MERTILLVDDVRLFLEIQKEFLKNSAVQVLTAKNGLDALQVISNKRPDLIFMDLEMPEMNGADCCRAIKSNPDSAGIPVVMITAKGDRTNQERCSCAGCNGFLTKPLDRRVFLETAGRFVPDIERRTERLALNLPAIIQSRGATLPCTMRNLSAGGAYLAAEWQIEVGRVIRIGFTLPDGAQLECQGTVVWCREPGGEHLNEFGVNFTLPPASTRDALSSFLKRVPSLA
jgi:CheY-like chemotaxis protein